MGRVHHHPIVCPCCGSTFIATRSDAKYCGVNCRVAAHRLRKRQREAEAQNGDDLIRARWIASLQDMRNDEIATLEKHYADMIEQARWDPITKGTRQRYAAVP